MPLKQQIANQGTGVIWKETNDVEIPQKLKSLDMSNVNSNRLKNKNGQIEYYNSIFL